VLNFSQSNKVVKIIIINFLEPNTAKIAAFVANSATFIFNRPDILWN